MSDKIPIETVDEHPRPDRCETCRFWETDHKPYEGFSTLHDIEQFNHSPAGECHRMPPECGLDADGHRYRQFPPTWTDDWCGEWQAKVPPVISNLELVENLIATTVESHHETAEICKAEILRRMNR